MFTPENWANIVPVVKRAIKLDHEAAAGSTGHGTLERRVSDRYPQGYFTGTAANTFREEIEIDGKKYRMSLQIVPNLYPVDGSESSKLTQADRKALNSGNADAALLAKIARIAQRQKQVAEGEEPEEQQ